ncbi:MAG: ECF transporter S component [Candidatus Odinarchaeota archaeon]
MVLKSDTQETSEEVKVIDTEQEKVNHSTWLEKGSFRVVSISTFTALAIVLGYILVEIPNIELFTLTIFLSGFILGKRDGMIIGFLSSLIYCLFNPLGASPLPLLTFQLIHYSLTGLIGALTRDYIISKKFFNLDGDLYIFPVMIIFGIIGALITVSFQIFSTLTYVFSFFGTVNEFWSIFLVNIGFTTIHIIGNTLGFIFILPGLIQLIKKMLN